jgi:demethylmenaquinone methyltransferase / 2-methoxy-6-polyprenyl-1,4-benzoquinol methylase
MPVDKSNTRVQQMFGAIAPQYDRMNHLLSLNTDHYWRWRTARLLCRQGEGPILDVCTGTGDLAFAFRRRVGDSVPIVGADFCPEMLEIGEQKRRRADDANRNISFVEADAQQLPFPDESFAVVAVAFGLRNVADTDQGLREMTRVCRTGGTVGVLEFSQPRWQPFGFLYGMYFRHVLPRLGQWLARNDHAAYNYLPESVGEFPAGEALLDRMRLAGLINTRFYPLTLGVATLYVGTKGESTP